jgi:hypothetical protein
LSLDASLKDKDKPKQPQPQPTSPTPTQPTTLTKEEDKGQLFDKGQFPGFVQQEFDRYWGTLTAEKTKYLAKLAQKDSFNIKIFKPNQFLDDPDADLPPDPTMMVDGFTEKTFKTFDATTAQWGIMQNLRAESATAEQLVRDKVLNAPAGGIPEGEMVELRKSVNEKDARAYYYQAKVFLRMSKDEFNRGDRTQVRDACDAMSHRTIISVPNSAKQSNPSYT